MFARSNEFEREWIELFYVPSLLFWQPPRFQRSLQCLAQRSRFHLFQPNNQYLGTKVGASLPERRPHNLVLQRLSTLGYGLPFGYAPQQLVDREYARRVFVNMVGVVRGQGATRQCCPGYCDKTKEHCQEHTVDLRFHRLFFFLQSVRNEMSCPHCLIVGRREHF